MSTRHKILIVSAHPDDEVLGCGGTAAKLVKDGCQVFTLILGEGVTSRDANRDRDGREVEIKFLKDKALRANETLGISDTFLREFPDNRFDTVPLLDIVKEIEEIKNMIRPDAVFTHFRGDLNIDHRITFNAVITACRPIVEETVKEIYSFEVASSTEWNYPNMFSPNMFVDIGDNLDLKLEAMKCYDTELMNSPHPRSLESIRVNASNWGAKMGMKHAEAFEIVRSIR